LVIVRLPNGSWRQLPLELDQASHCAPGKTISLLKIDTSYRVALEGCVKR
jgi:hypothetical protein